MLQASINASDWPGNRTLFSGAVRHRPANIYSAFDGKAHPGREVRQEKLLQQDTLCFSAARKTEGTEQANEARLRQTLSNELTLQLRKLRLKPQERLILERIIKNLRDPAGESEPLGITPEKLTSALVSIIYKHHPVTAEHSKRVSIFAVAIGRRMGLPKEKLHTLAIAGALHDAGKTGICHDYLNAPGNLAPAQRKQVENHSAFGAMMLRALGFMHDEKLKPIGEAVRAHHERWDGEGFPDRLSGNAIPQLARIVNVADVMDALLGVRSYKDRVSFPLFLSIMEHNRGTEFSPEVLDQVYRLPVKKMLRTMNRDPIHIKKGAREIAQALRPIPEELTLGAFIDLYQTPKTLRNSRENAIVEAFDTAYRFAPITETDPHGLVHPAETPHHAHHGASLHYRPIYA
jgi:HD-GYP domain-containing protein (c-di-GMP phosphodiesterase class II)